MTIRNRIALQFGLIVSVALLMLGLLAYHEFSTERQLRAALPSELQTPLDALRLHPSRGG